MQKDVYSFPFYLCFLSVCLHGAQGKDKVRLTDISTLTLYAGRYTTGRRSSPVPQVQCVGGSAGCNQYLPSVVQCYNRGHDGVDVQWECKADLDNRVKLGAIEVICEGYDYADDPYILKGSCGLEYQLNVKSGSGGGGSSSENVWKSTKQRGFVFSDLLILGIAALVVYALYKTCLTTPQYSSTSSDYPDGRPGSFGGSYPSSPPPPYSSGDYSQGYDGADCHSRRQGYRGSGGGGGLGSGSFWTGAATGGVLGYLFGQRGQGTSFGGGSRHHGYTSERNSDWGWGSGGSGATSSGTSSSTSFGGTRRR